MVNSSHYIDDFKRKVEASEQFHEKVLGDAGEGCLKVEEYNGSSVDGEITAESVSPCLKHWR